MIYETELWSFDQFRKYLPKAANSLVGQQANFWYTYYTLDSIEGKMLKIFTHGNCDISSREPNYNQLLVFKNEEEKQCFDSFISNHFNDHTDEEVIKKYQYQIQEDKET